MKSGQEARITTLTETFPTRRPFGAGYTGLARNFTSQRRFKGYRRVRFRGGAHMEETMHSLIYLVGLIVVVLLILSFLGLR